MNPMGALNASLLSLFTKAGQRPSQPEYTYSVEIEISYLGNPMEVICGIELEDCGGGDPADNIKTAVIRRAYDKKTGMEVSLTEREENEAIKLFWQKQKERKKQIEEEC